MTTMIEIHVLQNVPTSCLNRDEQGQPKTGWFGQAPRARVSSQSWKSAMRSQFDPADRGVRTRLLGMALAPRMRNRSAEDVAGIARVAFSALYDKTLKDDQGLYLLHLSPSEWDGIAALCHDHATALMALAANPKANLPKDLPSGFVEQFRRIIAGGRAFDIALFGRMIADHGDAWVEAACHVAHSLSTHIVPSSDVDYFTAADDLLPPGKVGAAMVGITEFTSACFYRYMSIDLARLQTTLGDRAGQAAQAAIRAWVLSMPSGRQHTMAAFTPPSLVFAVARQTGAARVQLSNAFVPAVKGSQEMDIIRASETAMDGHWAALSTAYGIDRQVTAAMFETTGVALPHLDGYRVAGLDALVSRVMEAQ